MYYHWKAIFRSFFAFVLSLLCLIFTGYLDLLHAQVVSSDQKKNDDNSQFATDGDGVVIRYNYKNLACRIILEDDNYKKLENNFGIVDCSHSSCRDICWKHAEKEGDPNLFGLSKVSWQNYLGPRGFIWHGEDKKWVLDYSGLVEKSSTILNDCVESLRFNKIQKPENVMEFVQSIKPKDAFPDFDEDFDRFTEGFRLPSSVMIENEGDCDSKAALFCSLLTHTNWRLVIFRSVPYLGMKSGEEKNFLAHALIGLIVGEDPQGLQKRFPDHWEKGFLKPGDYSEGFEFGDFEKNIYIPIEVNSLDKVKYGTIGKLPGYDQCLDQACPYVAIPITSTQ